MRIGSPILAALLGAGAFLAQAQSGIDAADREQIEALAARYSVMLFSCDAAGFADLFEPTKGFFASGFRGKVEGRQRLVALVESERHCMTPSPDGARGRPGGQAPPQVSIQSDSAGVFGTVDLGGAGQYQDQYVRTPAGWRFAARTVVTPAERAAGVDARAMAAIRALVADVPPHDRYVDGENGKPRYMSSGVVIRVEDGVVGGRVYLDDGGYYDDVYERTASGEWRIASRKRMPAGTN